MKTKKFIEEYDPRRELVDEMGHLQEMSEVWENCKRPDWMFWILEVVRPLKKEESVRLTIAFAESVLHLVEEGEERPRLAIEAAKKWLEDPSEENRIAARDAGSAAGAAARDAWSAAGAAARDAWSAARVAARDAAWDSRAAAWASARNAAWDSRAAAWAASGSATRAADWDAMYAARAVQCDVIRGEIENPFTTEI